jgi:hypothetical protein
MAEAEAPPRARFERFAEAFQLASCRAGLAPLHVLLADVRVDVEFAGEGLRARMGAPFRHLVCAGGEPGIVIRAWDSESSGVELPKELPSPGSVYAKSLPAFGADEDIRWTFFRPDPGLTAYDSSASRAVYWVPAASALTYGDIAGGFRAIITWALASRGIRFLHSAAIGWRGRGALVVGQSGSGKSSTALACLAAGLDYLGDDHCLLDLRDRPQVHSVYAAAKLHDAQLARFPEFDQYVVNRDRVAPDKAVAILSPAFDSLLPRSRPLAAVLVPNITGGGRSRIEPLSRGAALAALAPSTLLQMAAADREGMAAMGQLVRRVPCFRLDLGTDRAEIAERLREFLERLPADPEG